MTVFFSSMRKAVKLRGKHALDRAEKFISSESKDGRIWEVAQNCSNYVLLRRKD